MLRKALPASPLSAQCLSSQFNLQLQLWGFDDYGQTGIRIVGGVALLTVVLLLVLLVLLVLLPVGVINP